MSLFSFGRATVAAIAVSVAATLPVSAADLTLRGASLFDENHAYTKTLVKFTELVNEYSEEDIEFDIRLNSELGTEPDFVNFLTQGVAIDFAIIAPSNLARFADALPLMDMPFVFRDLDHWNAVLSSDVFTPLEEELREKADLAIVGYAGGGTRNLISNKEIKNFDDLNGHKMRVMGAPIQAQIFNALTASPSAIAYAEVYNAIQTGVVDGLENESASLFQYKFYEVAPHVTLTKHSITVRPIVFSGKSFDKLSPELQEAIMKAGKEAGDYGRALETEEDAEKLQAMQEAGNIQVHEFEGRDKMLEMVIPVQDAYAEELGAAALLEAIRTK
ncbi:TRAP transporter substrate-binding protein [Tropicimonas sediminicola]|uniref:Tripartite ATP-independent transporter solute receptor, DctP family n=1 Tax=Tropicimonas sediminicola TaxID=1031541 RepID=A0A239J228_9RHOB|nr:TRAP transporter substrate-binding protein [Tropicimonas sediminicola]SNS99870.1 tripartite ATP-independent transporter solute receptor, DctP family [Tropicimonas sediminicola]